MSRLGRNDARCEQKFERNFLSDDYVDFTRHEPCIFCRQHSNTVRTAHVLEGRKAGGCGGDYTATAPVCFKCDNRWATGGRLTFLAEKGLDWPEVVRRVQEHHEKYARRRPDEF